MRDRRNADVERALEAFGGSTLKYRSFGAFAAKPADAAAPVPPAHALAAGANDSETAIEREPESAAEPPTATLCAAFETCLPAEAEQRKSRKPLSSAPPPTADVRPMPAQQPSAAHRAGFPRTGSPHQGPLPVLRVETLIHPATSRAPGEASAGDELPLQLRGFAASPATCSTCAAAADRLCSHERSFGHLGYGHHASADRSIAAMFQILAGRQVAPSAAPEDPADEQRGFFRRL